MIDQFKKDRLELLEYYEDCLHKNPKSQAVREHQIRLRAYIHQIREDLNKLELIQTVSS